MKSGPDASSLEQLPSQVRLALEARLLGERRARPPSNAIPRRKSTGPCPPSFAQSRLWLAERINPVAGRYNMARMFRIRGAVNVDALRSAFDALVARHEVLRTRFVLEYGLPQQVVAAYESFVLEELDLTRTPADAQAHDAFVRRLTEDAFDLATDSLLRAGLTRFGEQESVLVIALHHIAADGWSMEVLDRELGILYAAFDAGLPAGMTALPIQYADFSEWQRETLRGAALDSPLAYWRQQLASLPSLELPTDRPRPAQSSFRGQTERFTVAAPLAAALKALSRERHVTLYMTLLAAFEVLLMRYSGQDDIAVGTPIAGRGRPELEGLIGFFVNTLVMRGDLSGNPTFVELLQRTRDCAVDAYTHQELPFEKLVEELNPVRDSRRNPLFQVMFTLQHAREYPLHLRGLEVVRVPLEQATSKFDLTLHIADAAGGLEGGFEFSTDLFDRATMRQMAGHFLRLLEGIVADPHARVETLPLLGENERRHLVVDWNATSLEFPRDRRLHELFEAQAASRPDAVAIQSEGAAITYGELDARADRLARHLRSLGVGPEVAVGICMERSVDMVAALIGVLKAGGAYVPLDPCYPAERLAFMLQDSAVDILLTQRAHLPHLKQYAGRVVCVDLDAALPALAEAGARGGVPAGAWGMRPAGTPPLGSASTLNDLAPAPTSNDLAYIIYTSGSTGLPKGVAIEHHSAVSFLHWVRSAFTDEELGGVLFSTSICFDLSIFELFGALSWGGKVVLVDNALDLAACAHRHEVSLVNTVPSIMRTLLEAQGLPPSVRTVNLAGEPLHEELVEALYAYPQVQRVHDLYGPSETTTYSTWVLRERGGSATIGKPIANTQIYLLDAHGQPVPARVTGELCIGGEGVARGYLGRPELTAERFVPDPFGGQPGARLYKTGDFARYRHDGCIEFLGRADSQVKLRGFRIELGEIEAVLARHENVRAAAVIVREDNPADKRLVAYVAAKAGAQAPSVTVLRALLRSKLPEYMLPSAFVFLPALPLTANGKIDRDALPPPVAASGECLHSVVAPRDNVELYLVRIWEDLFKRRSIGIRENFFDLGGHSLLAVQLMKRIDVTFNRQLELDILWSGPGTIEALANALREGFKAGDNPELILIKEGTRRPLFMMFTIAGRLFFYYELARRLASDQTVYGLQARGVFDAGRPDDTIEAIAAHCIETMRAVQPEGPYLIAGYSAGGVVAYEVAQQLVAARQRVELLAMLDTFAPPATAAGRWHRELRSLFRGRSSVRQIQEFLYFAVLHSLGLDRLRRLRTAGEAHRWAHWMYRPGPGTTPIELFVSENSAAKAVANQLGWTRWTTSAIRLHQLCGAHADLVKPPVVDDLAARLQQCVDAVGVD